MTVSSPTALVIKPDLRKRLQQRYEEARRLSTRALADRGEIHALLAECLRADPGNILYLDTLLANLEQIKAQQPRNNSLLSRFGDWLRGNQKAAPALPEAVKIDSGIEESPKAESAELAMLRSAPDMLWKSLGSAEVLRQLAEAAGKCELEEVEERYWQVAAAAAPQDAEMARGQARAFCRRGKFSEAVGAWENVLRLQEGDQEATTALSDLSPPDEQQEDWKPLSRSWQDAPHNVDTGMRLADALIRGGLFREAEQVLTDLQSAAGADLQVLDKRESLQMARSAHRLAIAKRRARSDSHPKAKSLSAQLSAEHKRLELDIYNLRCERLPEDWAIRLEAARRLKRIGNYSGAVHRLVEALQLNADEPALLIELGECWQHLRQFQRALDYYDKAAAKAKSIESGSEVHKLANYRLAVLATAMGQKEFARSRFRAILKADEHFKDARDLLDKLESN
jgi:tetratricopeptide (TPR) repeat protein